MDGNGTTKFYSYDVNFNLISMDFIAYTAALSFYKQNVEISRLGAKMIIDRYKKMLS